MIRASLVAVVTTFALATLPALAHAEGNGPVSVVKGQFTDKVEAGKPVGDPTSLAKAATATYWLDVSNSGKETVTITLVWSVDGKEAGKQTLDVGHSPHWRTWGTWSIKNAHSVAVKVLDADGNAIHDESLTLP